MEACRTEQDGIQLLRREERVESAMHEIEQPGPEVAADRDAQRIGIANTEEQCEVGGVEEHGLGSRQRCDPLCRYVL